MGMTGLEAKFHKTKSVSTVEEENPWKTVKSNNNNTSNAWNKRTSLGSIDAAFGTTSIPTTVKSRYYWNNNEDTQEEGDDYFKSDSDSDDETETRSKKSEAETNYCTIC